jgi:hypothetical protein
MTDEAHAANESPIACDMGAIEPGLRAHRRGAMWSRCDGHHVLAAPPFFHARRASSRTGPPVSSTATLTSAPTPV